MSFFDRGSRQSPEETQTDHPRCPGLLRVDLTSWRSAFGTTALSRTCISLRTGSRPGSPTRPTQLADAIDDLMADTGAERIHLIGEGTGGFAVRYFLQVLWGAELTDPVVTLMAPHNGTKVSGAGYWATGWQSFKDAAPDGALLQELNDAPYPDGLQLTSIYSCWDGYLVPYTTSVVDGATNVEFCAHKVKHFDSFQDTQVYQRLRLALDSEDAPTDY